MGGTTDRTAITPSPRVRVRFVGNQDHLEDEPVQWPMSGCVRQSRWAAQGRRDSACEAVTGSFSSGCDRASRPTPLPAGTLRPLHRSHALPYQTRVNLVGSQDHFGDLAVRQFLSGCGAWCRRLPGILRRGRLPPYRSAGPLQPDRRDRPSRSVRLTQTHFRRVLDINKTCIQRLAD
jgi:hypothetical protein